MKPVINLFTRQNFESMRLASQMLNIPVSKIKESADNKKPFTVRKRKYLFAYSTVTETRTFKVRRFTFGKYKGKLIKKCDDLSYLEWLVTLSMINAQFKHAIKERIKILKSKKDE